MIKPSTNPSNTAAGIIHAPSGDVYRLLKRIGKGGCGEVFKAKRDSDGRYVAVKRLMEVREAARFVREGKVLSEHPHPNLVEFVEFFEADTVWGDRELFLVMELLPRMPEWTLSHRYQTSRTGLDLLEALLLFCSYLEGLQHLHDQGIIHRDIKPGNLYAPAGSPGRGKLIDLGIARDTRGTTLTSGLVPGTWEYMAPELFTESGARGTPQSDLYSLGLCLYAAVVGQSAFPRTSGSSESALNEIVRRLQGEIRIDYRRGILGTHRGLQAVVQKATAERPEDRYPSAREMQVDVEALAAEVPDNQTLYERLDDDETRATIAAVNWTPPDDSEEADSQDRTQSIDAAAETPPPQRPKRARLVLPAALIALGMIGAVGTYVYTVRVVESPPQDQPAPVETAASRPAPDTPTPPPTGEIKPPAESDRDNPPDVQLAVDSDRTEPEPFPEAVPPPIDPEPWRMDPPTGLPSPAYLSRLASALAEASRAAEIRPEQANVQSVAEALQAIARSLPERFADLADQAFDQRDPARLAEIRRHWLAATERNVDMGLSDRDAVDRASQLESAETAVRLIQAVERLSASLPEPHSEDPQQLDAVESAAAWIVQTDVAHIRPPYQAPVRQSIRELAARLESLVNGYLHLQRDRALALLRNGGAAEDPLASLRRFQERCPSLVDSTAPTYDAVVDEISGWREDREGYETRVVALAAQITQSETDVDALERMASGIAAWPVPPSEAITPVEHQQRISDLRGALRQNVRRTIDAAIAPGLASTDPEGIQETRDALIEILHRAPTAIGLEMAAYQQALDQLNARLEAFRPPPEHPTLARLREALKDGDWPDQPLALPAVDPAGIQTLRLESEKIRRGFAHRNLFISNQPAIQFLASVHGAWSATGVFPSPARPSIQDAVWEIAHQQLALEFQRSLTGRTASRSPTQQARIRYEMLALLLRIEAITQRVSGCDPADPLRKSAEQFFKRPFYNPAMLTDPRGLPIDLTPISWLADAQARVAR